MIQKVDNKLLQLERDVQNAIDDIYAKYDQLQIDIMNELQAFRTQVNNEIVAIRNEMRANNQLVFTWVENRIQELIDDLPEILTVYVYNPYRQPTFRQQSMTFIPLLASGDLLHSNMMILVLLHQNMMHLN